jgi:antitoxin ParD1/3/4
MTTINISVPDSIQDFIDEQVARGGYGSMDEYIHQLINKEVERINQERVEALLLEGLSGEPIEITDDWWEQKQIQLIERLLCTNL